MKLIYLSIIILLLNSCKVTKDTRALGRVLSNPDLREQVYQVQAGLHPLLPTDPVYIKGKDSIIEIRYPVYIKGQDSIIQAQCPTLNLDSLKKALTTIKIIRSVDTLKVPDTTLRRMLDNAITSNYKLTGQLIEKDKQTEAYKKQNGKRNRIDIIGGAAALLIVGFLVYILIRKP